MIPIGNREYLIQNGFLPTVYFDTWTYTFSYSFKSFILFFIHMDMIINLHARVQEK